MPSLPNHINPGQSRLKAADWNFLIGEVRRLAKDSVTKVLNAGGFVGGAPRERTVLVTAAPTSEDMTLTVSPVRYASTPPQQCEGEGVAKECFYELSPELIEVYPDFGSRAIDYEDDVFGGGTVDDTASFLRMYFEAGTWRLQRPGGVGVESKLVIAWPLQTEPETGRIVSVQPIKLNDEGVIEQDGELQDVMAWGGMTLADYKPLYTMITPPVLRIDKYDTVWYLRQIMPWATGEPSGRATSSCTVP